MPTVRPLRTTANPVPRLAGRLSSVEAIEARRPPAQRLRPRARHERPRVLHVGCGPASATRLHAAFHPARWQEVRLDVDAAMRPDIAASIVDMNAWIEDESCEAVWASHVIEHLNTHEVPVALDELRRVLAMDGFALIRCPDMETVAQFIVDGRLTDVIYTSAAGPITPLDMIFGHGESLARGQTAMRHGTAFTEQSLADALMAAGFSEVRTRRTEQYEIWAAAFRERASVPHLLEQLAQAGTELRQ